MQNLSFDVNNHNNPDIGLFSLEIICQSSIKQIFLYHCVFVFEEG